MYDDQEILEQIKKIECPTDAVMDRVIGVLEDYRPSGGYQITSEEDDDYINDDMKVYRAYSESPEAPSIVVKVREGSDHYVASVVDAYIEDEEDGDFNIDKVTGTALKENAGSHTPPFNDDVVAEGYYLE